MEAYLEQCSLCPRECRVNRLAGQAGYCGQTAQIHAARAALHFWEEPCISGRAGSGAVFFSGCTLRCAFCQNRDIAAGYAGQPISQERLAEIFLKLQTQGANNINLVTPTQFSAQIAAALRQAKEKGLHVPVVYNTSAYERVDALQRLEGLVDIYLPDLKYVSQTLSAALSGAPDYFEVAKAAIAEMVRQVGEPVFAAPDGRKLCAAEMNEACEGAEDADFLMERGVIVRHLALPGQEADSRQVLRYLHETYGERIYISIMNQYTPMPGVEEQFAGGPYEALGRKLSEEEYERLVDYAVELGIENGFLQEGETAEESFIPAFDGEGL